jgi:hypothetical protein
MRLIAATIDGLVSANQVVDQLNSKAAVLEANGYRVLGFNLDTVSRTYTNQFEGIAFILVEPPQPAQAEAQAAEIPPIEGIPEPTPIAKAKPRRDTKKATA